MPHCRRVLLAFLAEKHCGAAIANEARSSKVGEPTLDPAEIVDGKQER
jgi:hypothetical protein